jgi:hypothetical protein
MTITVPPPIPISCPVTNIMTTPVTRDIMINTLMQLPVEAKLIDKDVIAKYASHSLEGITLLYDWASHRFTLCISYKTPILSETAENLFVVFKASVDEFSFEEEKLNERYPEKGKQNVLPKKCVTSCIALEAKLLKLLRHCAIMHCCIYLKTSDVTLYLNYLTSYVDHKMEMIPPLRALVPCPSAAVVRGNHNLIF